MINQIKNRNLIFQVILSSILLFTFFSCKKEKPFDDEKIRVIKLADQYLNDKPITITEFICERSMGNKNDFYSEGDYWWANPKDPNGPYIRKDGLTNPNNFTAHRKAMRQMSIIVPALVAAYRITGNNKYAKKAIEHLTAWFITASTKMNPNLLFAQAIKGKVTGRGIGIIDTIHLIEVAKAIIVLNDLNAINNSVFADLKNWFAEYLKWLTTHKYGTDERDHGNNHSTWWAAQVAMFARLADNQNILKYIRTFYKRTLLPNQMDIDGSFPDELARTKPYNYSIFNLDAMTMVCEIAGTDDDNLWNYSTTEGKSMHKGIEFLFPYLQDKSKWTYKKDISHWDDLPVRSPSLLFASIHFNEPKYFKVWKKLKPYSNIEEIIRTFPIRQPLLWIDK